MNNNMLQPVVQETVVPQDEVRVQVVESSEVDTKAQQPVDESVVQLSTGVLVRFHTIPSTIAQEIVTSIFEDTQLTSDGRIRENLSQSEQLALASSMMDLNSALISAGGVELVSELPKDNSWLDALSLNPVIARKHPRIDFNRPNHIKFLFLRYEAFDSEDDWAMLSQNTIGQ